MWRNKPLSQKRGIKNSNWKILNNKLSNKNISVV